MKVGTHIIWAVVFFLISQLSFATDNSASEASSGKQLKPVVIAKKMMVITANPYATQVSFAILKQGGSAIDAAIAAQLVLGLTEPQSSGLGGGGYLLYWNGQKLDAWDGRETAPAAATENDFLNNQGKPLEFYDAVIGGRSVGVPGILAMLKKVHAADGKLAWERLFTPAIQLAEKGFRLSPRLYKLLLEEIYLKQDPKARTYFYQPDGQPKPIGTLLVNPEYAETLKQIAKEGSKVFYQGKIGQAIVKAVRHHPKQTGHLTLSALTQYQAKQREPLCVIYRAYRICGMPPSSSGGFTVLQMLKLLEGFELKRLKPTEPEFVHLFTSAQRLAFADRNYYLADPDKISVPVYAFFNDAYLNARRLLVDKTHLVVASPGIISSPLGGRDTALEKPSTTHLVIVDSLGHVVSMTSSIEDGFGSRIWVKGFLLNNQLTDFSFEPRDEKGRLVANRIESGKRPRSSMAPTIVFDQTGKFLAALGSPGGSQIIPYVAQTLIAILDQHLTPQEAVSLPHFSNRNGATEFEQGSNLDDSIAKALKTKGHDEIKWVEMTSGLSVILKTPDGYVSGTDPRREGLAMGE